MNDSSLLTPRSAQVRQAWDRILIEQADSGLTKKAFCEQRGLNPATFYYWQRRLRTVEQEDGVGFQRVFAQPERDHELTVRLGSVEVVLGSPSAATLAQVIKALINA